MNTRLTEREEGSLKRQKLVILLAILFLAGFSAVCGGGLYFTGLWPDLSAYAQTNGTETVQLLARAINGEARGESYLGQVAVGAVIINRTRDSRFPKTIPGVIYQPGAFTAVSDGQINVQLDAQSMAVKAAGDALNGFDPTDGCLYYWNPATATSQWIWSRPIAKQIGKHYFAK